MIRYFYLLSFLVLFGLLCLNEAKADRLVCDGTGYYNENAEEGICGDDCQDNLNKGVHKFILKDGRAILFSYTNCQVYLEK